MNRLACLAVPAALLVLSTLIAGQTGRIVVSPNHHFLQHEDGTPFFWQGDTAWLLFSKLDRAETERYLEDRRSKGFNVIQVMVLHDVEMKTAYGVPALVNGDPAKPHVTPGADLAKRGEYDFWDHVDWVLDRAAEKGLYLALVPAWGSVVKAGQLNAGNVEAYARFLAERYKDRPNIFWIVGGDIQGDGKPEVWQHMGHTLKALDPNHLITFHPYGRMQSSTWFHNEPWLDFNMFQSGHRRYDQDTDSPHRYGEDNWRYVAADYVREPAKPVLDGEPSYENIPQGLHDSAQPYWRAADCRRYAYWSVFAGAFGHTYGHNAVMQFHKPTPTLPGKQTTAFDGNYGVKDYWYDALDHPGARQMQFLQRLMLSRPYFERVPDQSALSGTNGIKYDYIGVTRGASYLFAYVYTGKPIHLRLGMLTGDELRMWWYNPRNGASHDMGKIPNRGIQTFTPPVASGAPVNDWVLVIDDAAKQYGTPGETLASSAKSEEDAAPALEPRTLMLESIPLE